MTGPVAESDPAAPDRVPDAVLGSARPGRCTVAIPDARQPRTGLTLSAWVRWADPPGPRTETPTPAHAEPDSRVVGDRAPGSRPVVALHLTRLDGGRTRIDVLLGDERFDAVADLDTPAPPPPAAGPGLDAGEWHRLAVLWDGPSRTARLLVDGETVVEHPTAVDHLPFRRDARLEITGGLVGPVRLHARPRTAAELTTERLADLAAHPTTDESAPLAFRLADAADEPTLSITDDDVAGRALHVVLHNRSAFPVPLPTADTPRERRLELRFRPGALVGHPRSAHWPVEVAHRPDGGVSLFLAPPAPLTLAPGATVAVTVDHVRAAGDAGSHGTHVELRHPHPHHPQLWSVRTAVAWVVGRRGRRRSPLRFGVAGDPTVVPDGVTPTTLRFYVANSSTTRPVTLTAPVGGVGTTFVLGADAGRPGDPWTLGTADQLLAAQVSVDPPDWRIEVDARDESPEWVLTPTRDQELGPSARIEIVVGDLLTGPGPAGRTRVGLRTENVPGYWDDDRHVDVERSVVVRDRGPAGLRVHGEIHDRYGELLPPGTVVMWHGSTVDIPAGWVLCDSGHGTPDLRGRFVRGRGPDDTAEREGGSDTVVLDVGHLPAHGHAVEVATAQHAHDVPTPVFPTAEVIGTKRLLGRRGSDLDFGVNRALTALQAHVPLGEVMAKVVAFTLEVHQQARYQLDGIAEGGVQAHVPGTPRSEHLVTSHTSGARGTGHAAETGGGVPVDNRPAFYELCYIMKRHHPRRVQR